MNTELEKREKREVANTAPEQLENSGVAFSPDTDVHATKDDLLLLLEVPGVKKGGIRIGVDENDVLTVWAKSSFQEPGEAAIRQFSTGDWYRAFQISEDYDKERLSAKLENGLLAVNIPLREEAKPRRVEIQV